MFFLFLLLNNLAYTLCWKWKHTNHSRMLIDSFLLMLDTKRWIVLCTDKWYLYEHYGCQSVENMEGVEYGKRRARAYRGSGACPQWGSGANPLVRGVRPPPEAYILTLRKYFIKHFNIASQFCMIHPCRAAVPSLISRNQAKDLTTGLTTLDSGCHIVSTQWTWNAFRIVLIIIKSFKVSKFIWRKI